MAEYREEVLIDMISVDEYGAIAARQVTRVYRDEELISETFFRMGVERGQSTDDQDPRVKAIADALWDSFEWRERPVEPPMPDFAAMSEVVN